MLTPYRTSSRSELSCFPLRQVGVLGLSVGCCTGNGNITLLPVAAAAYCYINYHTVKRKRKEDGGKHIYTLEKNGIKKSGINWRHEVLSFWPLQKPHQNWRAVFSLHTAIVVRHTMSLRKYRFLEYT